MHSILRLANKNFRRFNRTVARIGRHHTAAQAQGMFYSAWFHKSAGFRLEDLASQPQA